MWVDQKSSWIKVVAVGGFALPKIWTRTLVVTAISVVVTVLYEEVPALHHSLTAAPFTIVGLPLGIFLGFRNNTAYDRWWEGRKLWGALVNTTRSFTRQILTMLEPQAGAPSASYRENATSEGGAEAADVRKLEKQLVNLVIAYVHAFRHHLRDHTPFDKLGRLLPAEEVDRFRTEDNVPLGILQRIADLLVEARRKGWIHPFHVNILEQSLVSLTDVQGACERIKNTPVPYSYTVLMHRIVGGYCVMLPLGLMETVKWATPLVVLVISYCFFGLDAIGGELEQPFGLDTNDLPLRAISRTIERNLRTRIGEPLPEAATPRNTILT